MSGWTDVWRARFGQDPPAEFPDFELALNRRSCRSFSNAVVAPELVESLIGVSLAGSSSCGLQTWSVVSVEDRDGREFLWQSCARQDHVLQAPWFLVFCADLSRAERVGAASDDLEETEFFLMAVMDASIAAERMVSAAEQAGLGACYVGSLRNHVESVSELLAVPPRVLPLFGVCLGWPGEGTGNLRPRLKPRDVWHRDRYVAREDFNDYDARMKPYFAEMKRVSELTWQQRLRDRLDRHHREGRGRLAEWLRARGLMLR